MLGQIGTFGKAVVAISKLAHLISTSSASSCLGQWFSGE
jgi:hypothetical protein